MAKHRPEIGPRSRNIHRLRAQRDGRLACFSTDLAAVENAIVLSVPLGLSSAASVILSATILFFLEWRMALAATLGPGLCLLGSRLTRAAGAPH